MGSKLGVYICEGCSIGESLDVPRLMNVAQKEYKVPVCRTHKFLCGDEGLSLIRKDLVEDAVDSVVIAGCSPRMKTADFSFDPRVVMDRVNLREHVAWSHKGRDEDTQLLAEDYLRMGIVKAGKMAPAEPLAEGISKAILVVGGGIAGISAALGAADADYDVVLVEKTPRLGGSLADLKKLIPTHSPCTEIEENGIADKIQKLTSHPKIKVHTSTAILKTEGQPGMFDVTLKTAARLFSAASGPSCWRQDRNPTTPPSSHTLDTETLRTS